MPPGPSRRVAQQPSRKPGGYPFGFCFTRTVNVVSRGQERRRAEVAHGQRVLAHARELHRHVRGGVRDLPVPSKVAPSQTSTAPPVTGVPPSARTVAVTVARERTPGSRGAVVAVVAVDFGGLGSVKPTSVGSWSLERYAFGRVEVGGVVVVTAVLVGHRLDRVDVPHVRVLHGRQRLVVDQHVVERADQRRRRRRCTRSATSRTRRRCSPRRRAPAAGPPSCTS